MKPLIPQTVYVPTKNKSDFQVQDPSFGVSNAYVKTGYFLSKEELIELLTCDSMLKKLRWEFLFATQSYPKEYHKLFEEKYNRTEITYKEHINKLLNNDSKI